MHSEVGLGSQPVTHIYCRSMMTDLTVQITIVRMYSTMYHVLCTLYVRIQQGTAHAIILIAIKNANKKSNGNSRTVHITEADSIQ